MKKKDLRNDLRQAIEDINCSKDFNEIKKQEGHWRFRCLLVKNNIEIRFFLHGMFDRVLHVEQNIDDMDTGEKQRYFWNEHFSPSYINKIKTVRRSASSKHEKLRSKLANTVTRGQNKIIEESS